MLTHRTHMPYYQQVAVLFWPILFFELWQVDRWQAETGRQAFVVVDRYGRAWVPYWEGMRQHYHLHGMDTEAYAPSDIAALCPGWLSETLTTADASASWGLWAEPSSEQRRAYRPWISADSDIAFNKAPLEPG